MESDQTELQPTFFKAQLETALLDRPKGPSPATIVASAERALRRRRYAWTSGVCAVIALAGISMLVASQQPTHKTSPQVAAPVAPDGWQEVRWEGGSFAVPPNWVPGDPSQWCISGPGSDVGRFSTPSSGGSTAAGCNNPENSYGANLQPTSSVMNVNQADPVQTKSVAGAPLVYPEGAWIATRKIDDDWTFVVVASDAKTADEIVNSLKAT